MSPGLRTLAGAVAIVTGGAYRPVIIVPSWWKVIWRLHRLSPLFGFYLSGKPTSG